MNHTQYDWLTSTFQEQGGILRLMPNFVPRRFGTPGRRLRLHPDDYHAMGMHRGAIKERWFTSVVQAQNGPDTAPCEGMSSVICGGDIAKQVLFRDAAEALGEELIGGDVMAKHGAWPMFAKFFDFNEPLFFHLHLKPEHAALVGRNSKPEAYYFPTQYNPHTGTLDATYFGLRHGVTKEDIKARIRAFRTGDNRITDLSTAYRVTLGTGWYTAPGVLHAPASLLTYEPQWNSDVNAVFENFTGGQVYGYSQLVENCPEDKWDDLDFIVDLIDWEVNRAPDYRERYFRPPVQASADPTHEEKWIVYGTEGHFSAKELTVQPGCSVTIRDPGAFGCVVVQGHGVMNQLPVEAPVMLRFGQPSGDECFVSAATAFSGVTYVNQSKTEPLVILKHFAMDYAPVC